MIAVQRAQSRVYYQLARLVCITIILCFIVKPAYAQVTSQWADYSTNSGWTSQVVGDFNNDGLDDIANFHPSNGTWWVSTSNGTGFNTTKWEDYSTNSGWTSQVVGDFNNDGRDDIASFHSSNGTWWVSTSNGTGFNTTKWEDYSTNDGWTSQVVGDFNNDGLDDIASFHPSNGTWWVSTSSGTGFNTTKWEDYSTNDGWTSQVVGDFNNDGLDDIASFHPSNGTWWVSTSNGTGFNTTKWEDYSINSGWTSQVVGDFNNDGLDDIANFHPSNGTWWVSTSNGTGFNTTKWEDYSTNSGWTSQVVGDFNNDGRDDIASFHPTNGTWWISTSNGTGFDTTLWADYTTNSGWTSQVVGDFNNDSLDDIANFHPTNGRWWVTLTDSPAIYVSSSTGGKVDGIRFADEDILTFDPTTNSWAMYFDGSDIDLKKWDVNAFHVLDNGDILMSFNKPKTLAGLKYDDSDIAYFTGSSWGTSTAGSFSMYLDGSTVGLTTGGEDIDAISFTSDGDLVISTLGTAKVNAGSVLKAQDEDLIRLDSSGIWHLYLDGSDVGLEAKSEDIWATWIDSNTDEVHLSTTGNYNVPGPLTGDSDDVFICTPGSLGLSTNCAFSLFWDGDLHGYGAEKIDGYAVGPAPMVLVSSASIDRNNAEIDEASEEYDTSDDDVLEEEEIRAEIYLPLISH